MENKEAIIRKLNALKAKANDPTIKDTPEAISAMAKFNELMQRYNLTLTDLEVKAQGINFGPKKTAKGKENAKTRHPIAFCTLRIAAISNTEIVTSGWNSRVFVGTPSDIQYAEFLYDLIYNSAERAAIAYKMSADYQRDINLSKLKGDEIMWNYKYGFVIACNEALVKMIAENYKSQGPGLVVLKNELIKAFLDEQGTKAAGSGKGVAVKDHMQAVVAKGFVEGEKLKLRNEVTNIAGYLE